MIRKGHSVTLLDQDKNKTTLNQSEHRQNLNIPLSQLVGMTAVSLSIKALVCPALR